MTNRHSAYIVVLSKDMREDDAEPTLTALRMVKGVQSVEPVIAESAQMIAHMRADSEWRDALVELVRHGPRKVGGPDAS